MSTRDHNTQLLIGKLETEAVRLLHQGHTAGQITERLGIPLDRLRELAAEQPRSAVRCPHAQCGQPQEGPGHPRKGWVQTKVAGEQLRLWFCSWGCVVRHGRQRLGGAR